MSKNVKFLQGNEVCVEAALYSGLDFFAGYPITPSTEIAEHMAVRLPQIGGKFLQMEDEIASMCAIIGASLTGHKVMTATSGPGFSLMQEALGYAIMTEIPCVIVNVQRGGPSTGLPTNVSQGDIYQARWGAHGDHAIIAMTASNHQDVFETTIAAFNLAETYRTPVILLFDEVVGHMREKLVIPEKGELEIVDRLRTSLGKGVDYHPYLPREDGRLPMSDFGGEHRYKDCFGSRGVTKNLADRLKGISFFQDLSPEPLALVCERMVRREVPAGSILFRKGEQARGVYVLVAGRVEIYRSTPDGREQVLHTETPIQSVAELPVFDGGTYPASGRTAEDSDPCSLCGIATGDRPPRTRDAFIEHIDIG